MTKRKNSPQKNLQEITTANELIKKGFKQYNRKWIENNSHKINRWAWKQYKGQQRISCYRDQGTKEQPGGAKKNAINEVQNKMEAAIAWIEEAEERIGELEDKIMEKEEADKKR